jgi:hypothetical protein
MSVPAKPFSFGDWKRTQAEKKKLEAAESRRKLTVSPINGGEKAAAAAVPKPAAAGTVMVARKPKPNLLPSQQRGYVPEPSASGTVPVQRKVMKPRAYVPADQAKPKQPDRITFGPEPPPPAGGGGSSTYKEGDSLMDGAYDEQANAREFQAAIAEWRNGSAAADGPVEIAHEGGQRSLADGVYDERANAREFQSAINEWRGGGATAIPSPPQRQQAPAARRPQQPQQQPAGWGGVSRTKVSHAQRAENAGAKVIMARPRKHFSVPENEQGRTLYASGASPPKAAAGGGGGGLAAAGQYQHPTTGPGALADGDYDELQNAREFQSAVSEWRGGGAIKIVRE